MIQNMSNPRNASTDISRRLPPGGSAAGLCWGVGSGTESIQCSVFSIQKPVLTRRATCGKLIGKPAAKGLADSVPHPTEYAYEPLLNGADVLAVLAVALLDAPAQSVFEYVIKICL
jgi:hypothetical protein